MSVKSEQPDDDLGCWGHQIRLPCSASALYRAAVTARLEVAGQPRGGRALGPVVFLFGEGSDAAANHRPALVPGSARLTTSSPLSPPRAEVAVARPAVVPAPSAAAREIAWTGARKRSVVIFICCAPEATFHRTCCLCFQEKFILSLTFLSNLLI